MKLFAPTKNIYLALLFLSISLLPSTSYSGYDVYTKNNSAEIASVKAPFEARIRELNSAIALLADSKARKEAEKIELRLKSSDFYSKREEYMKKNFDAYTTYQGLKREESILKTSVASVAKLQGLLSTAADSSLGSELQAYVERFLEADGAEKAMVEAELNRLIVTEVDIERKKSLESVAAALSSYAPYVGELGQIQIPRERVTEISLAKSTLSQIRAAASGEVQIFRSLNTIVLDLLKTQQHELLKVTQDRQTIRNRDLAAFDAIDELNQKILIHDQKIIEIDAYTKTLETESAAIEEKLNSVKAEMAAKTPAYREWEHRVYRTREESGRW